jgi:hypothetical protein
MITAAAFSRHGDATGHSWCCELQPHPMRITRAAVPGGPGEPGDIVYNEHPQVGGYVGWVWIDAATGWKPFGKIDEATL